MKGFQGLTSHLPRWLLRISHLGEEWVAHSTTFEILKLCPLFGVFSSFNKEMPHLTPLILREMVLTVIA